MAPDHAGVGEGGGHAVVFEAAGGIQAFVLQQQLAGLHAELLGEQVGLLQDGPAFADGDDVALGAVERQQLAEAPDAGEIEPAGDLPVPLVAQRCSKKLRLLGTGSLFQS